MFNILKILNNIQFIRFGIIHKKFGIIKIINKVLIQFISKLKIVVDGSKILNKFVVIFYIIFIMKFNFYIFNKIKI